jgi:hypothetical protein
MILEVELLDGDSSLKPFHQVLCLGVDRRGDVAKRCGMFCLPKEYWDTVDRVQIWVQLQYARFSG